MRTLRRAPGFSLLSIAILGISVGATASVLSAFHALRMKPLPFRDAGQLVAIDGSRKGTPGQGAGWSDLDDWKRTTNAFQAISGCSPRTYGMALTQTDPVEVLLSCQVTPAFFDVFDVQPLIGRPMRGDDANTRPGAVWLGHKLWQSRFGADAQITRRTLFLNEEPFLIAGVL
ncbi:MAG: ABC transporter permease, partial [Bryobacterales bacterium]|nr:ABC transporter permease [Bryobacterales bacterium]